MSKNLRGFSLKPINLLEYEKYKSNKRRSLLHSNINDTIDMSTKMQSNSEHVYKKPNRFRLTPRKINLTPQKIIKSSLQSQLNTVSYTKQHNSINHQLPISPVPLKHLSMQKVLPSEDLKKKTTIMDRILIDHMKQQFISIYIKQKLKYEGVLMRHGVQQQVDDGQFKLFLAKLTNY